MRHAGQGVDVGVLGRVHRAQQAVDEGDGRERMVRLIIKQPGGLVEERHRHAELLSPAGVDQQVVRLALDQHSVGRLLDAGDAVLQHQAVAEQLAEEAARLLDQQHALAGQHQARHLAHRHRRFRLLAEVDAGGGHDQPVGGEVDQAFRLGNGVDVLGNLAAQLRVALHEAHEAVTRLHPGAVMARVVEPQVQAELVVAGGLVQRPRMLLEHGDLEAERLERCTQMAAVPAGSDDGDPRNHGLLPAVLNGPRAQSPQPSREGGGQASPGLHRTLR